ncbi:hypothetical protein F4778DRAFT_560952 [Xylariomycetidae sp. FL2044]|nr:hypothetical protein F4778DRAFT_560952 [Xylariomycetidae sp. FL2044]
MLVRLCADTPPSPTILEHLESSASTSRNIRSDSSSSRDSSMAPLSSLEYRESIIENCEFFVGIDDCITIITAKDPGTGLFKSYAIRGNSLGREVILASDAFDTRHQAIDSLDAKSCEAVHHYIESNGFSWPPDLKKARLDESYYSDAEEEDDVDDDGEGGGNGSLQDGEDDDDDVASIRSGKSTSSTAAPSEEEWDSSDDEAYGVVDAATTPLRPGSSAPRSSPSARKPLPPGSKAYSNTNSNSSSTKQIPSPPATKKNSGGGGGGGIPKPPTTVKGRRPIGPMSGIAPYVEDDSEAESFHHHPHPPPPGVHPRDMIPAPLGHHRAFQRTSPAAATSFFHASPPEPSDAGRTYGARPPRAAARCLRSVWSSPSAATADYWYCSCHGPPCPPPAATLGSAAAILASTPPPPPPPTRPRSRLHR